MKYLRLQRFRDSQSSVHWVPNADGRFILLQKTASHLSSSATTQDAVVTGTDPSYFGTKPFIRYFR